MFQLDANQMLDARLSGRRRNDRFFMELVETLNDGVAVTDCDRKILYLNQQFRAMTDDSDEQAIGRDLLDRFDHPNSPILKNAYRECLKYKHARSTAELSWQQPSGRTVKARIALTAIDAEDPKNRLFFVVLTDISEFKNAQKAIIHSEHKYKAVVENSLAGLFIEQDRKILFANQRLAEILGFEINDLIGMKTHLFFQPEYNDSNEEIQTCRKDGKSIWLKLSCRRITYQGRSAILGNIIEISREKILEYRLLDLEQDLYSLSDQFQTAQELQKMKIALEIHNGIGKSLAEIQSMLENVTANRSDGSNLGDQLNGMAALLQKAAEETKKITMTLHPAILDDIGLKATILWHCHQFQNIHPSIKISLIVNIDESQLSESIKSAIYMILQEALNEIAEHFGTARVKIHLFTSTEMLNLVIKDDGVSLLLNTDEPERPYFFGLDRTNLKKRIHQSGGRFAIGKNQENHGQYLCFFWPIDTTA
ncbi:MAG: PAS domain-containing sensor histidine kinase [Gammaproteobacteria bacterium]